MTTHQATLLDWSQVSNSVSAFQTSLGLKDHREAFSYFALSKILKLDDDELRTCLTDGSDDRGIDGIFIDTQTEKKVVRVFQFKHVKEFKKVSSAFPSNEIDKILSFLECVLRQDEGLEATCNPYLWMKVRDIWSLLEEGVATFAIHLCSNASKLDPRHAARFKEALAPYQFTQLYEHDLNWFSRKLTQRQESDREYELPLVEDQLFGRTDGFANGLTGTVRAESLVELIRDPNFPHEVDDSLFEENIRLYLGEQNEINRRILSSALSPESAEFWYLNNGITIVCDSLTYQPRSANPKARLKNPQIVNGGQTSHALFEAARGDAGQVRNVRLLVRVIETKDREFVNRIATATNSQTPIRSRDIRSNDSIQIRLENALAGAGYFYERKNDQHINQPSGKRIDAVKLGQIVLAYVLKEPDRAKTASNKIFGEYYNLVFDEEILSADNVVSLWKIYRIIENDRREAVRGMGSRISKSYREAWLVEGMFHVLYMLSLRCEISGVDKFDFDTVLSFYEDVKGEVDEYVKDNPSKAAYRIFRSSMTKRLLAKHAQSRQLELSLAQQSDS